MADDDSHDFRVRAGRPRSPRAGAGAKSFLNQIQAAVRKAGGDPNRIGGSAGKGSGRFNARGRGAKLTASFPKDGGGWRRDSAGRFRARRVVVKARVVKLNPQPGGRGPKMRGAASKAADAHLRYLERDGRRATAKRAAPIPSWRMKRTAAPSSSAGAKIGISSASSSPLRTPPRWATCGASPAT